ncbi:MAG: DNA replication/repair protein RecF [Chloroflexi bacterium]|nr:DNA replication/repair protein RecF [Ardenticatenaceae bacterium]MBL1129129.1 DNA replication/repair protein RecF [Chloroflexota bacterium]NOG35207.1 DNA replication/repair protein RecF [Chloroflexota bacterium]
MYISHLSLTNFRNYGRLELDLSPGATLLYGQNAQGKTNLLEAIYYLATTRSPHAEYDNQLLNWDAAETEEPVVVGRLVAQAQTATETKRLEMRLILERNGRARPNSFRREVLVDRRKMRLMDLLGHLRVVLFLPEDVQLITGSPAERRRYMDITLCQIDTAYCRSLSQYNKVLEQRNALLRQIAEGSGSLEVLPIFTDKLITLGSQIVRRRALFLAGLARETQRVHYESLTNGRETIRLQYLPRLAGNGPPEQESVASGEWLSTEEATPTSIKTQLAEVLRQIQPADIARGVTSVGPHRDDWRFLLNGRALSSYGSRGQQRTAILALKMAEINWMTAVTGEQPILLLDEVMAELDAQRRAALLHTVQSAQQAILTATDPAMFTAEFLANTTSLQVSNGRISYAESTGISGQ